MEDDGMTKKESLDYKFGMSYWNAVVCLLCITFIAALCVALKIDNAGLILAILSPFLVGLGYNGNAMYRTQQELNRLK